MKIAVNTRFLLDGALEGVGWYTYEVFSRLVASMPNDEFYFFFDRPYDPKFVFGENVTPVVLKPQSRHPLLWFLWFEYAVPKALKKYDVDLFISTDGYCSLSTDVRQIMVVHDIAFEHFSDNIKFSQKFYLKRYAPKFSKKADQILTVSEFTKHDLMDKYGIAADKITVAHNGVSAHFHPSSEEEQRNKITEFGGHYFLYVGALHPRKNIPRLLKAFELFKRKTSASHKLVIVGRKAWGNKEMEDVYKNMSYKSDVVFKGHADQKELNKVYGGALALIYPSLFEGFGLPVLEAMKCNIPVITSQESSMSEICADAAVYVDPCKVSDIVVAMESVLDKNISSELTRLGAERAQKFNWNDAAKKLKGLIEKG